MDFMTDPGGWLSLLGTLAVTALGYVTQRYVVPFLKVGRRQRYAEYVAAIADDAIDELRSKYPDKQWLVHLDEAVETVVRVTGLSQDVSRRSVRAAAARR